MPLDPQLRKQLAETIYVATATGVNEYGNPSYSPPVAVAARIQHLVRKDRSSIAREGGHEVFARARMIVESVVGVEDRIWLPGANPADAGQAQTPIRVAPIVDELGRRIGTEVWL